MPSSLSARPRVVLEQRKSDFQPGSRVNAYTGSGCCCCCCCLHWAGALVGGAIGFRLGWRSGKAGGTSIPHRRIQRAISWGVVLGILASVGLLVTFAAIVPLQDWLIVPALVPSALILPPMVTALLGVRYAGFRLRWLHRRALRKLSAAAPADSSAYRLALPGPRVTVPALDGVELFCTSCWDKVDTGEVALHCRVCDEPIAAPAFPDEKRGLRLAWHATGKAFLWSTGLSVAGYAIMWLIAVVMT